MVLDGAHRSDAIHSVGDQPGHITSDVGRILAVEGYVTRERQVIADEHPIHHVTSPDLRHISNHGQTLSNRIFRRTVPCDLPR